MDMLTCFVWRCNVTLSHSSGNAGIERLEFSKRKTKCHESGQKFCNCDISKDSLYSNGDSNMTSSQFVFPRTSKKVFTENKVK